ISDKDGTMTFYRRNDESHEEWGFSVIKHFDGAKEDAGNSAREVRERPQGRDEARRRGFGIRHTPGPHIQRRLLPAGLCLHGVPFAERAFQRVLPRP
ncbi:hypothetical protein THAOC_17464, partial [Thalassiosira oceanica]